MIDDRCGAIIGSLIDSSSWRCALRFNHAGPHSAAGGFDTGAAQESRYGQCTARDLDLPSEKSPGPQEIDLSDGMLSGGLVVMAAALDVPDGKVPALIYRFAAPDGSGFYPPMVLVVDEDQMTKPAQLVASATAAAITAATT